jgi:RNA polymerase sigma factor (sigma-70 family)
MLRRSDDALLIGLARRGSAAAYERLFRKYWRVAWQAAHAVTLDRALADDVAQETMERFLGTLERFDERRPLGPWVKRIAVNRAIDELRRDRRLLRGEVSEEEGPLWREDAPPHELALAQAVAVPSRRSGSSSSCTTGSTTACGRSRRRSTCLWAPSPPGWRGRGTSSAAVSRTRRRRNMQRDLDRLLRDARGALAEPDAGREERAVCARPACTVPGAAAST